MDRHTKTIDNSVGQVVSMPRYKVDDNRNNTCSSGLHFCSLSYLKNCFGFGDNVVILKINPRDVVSIPSDYNNSKGRCCLYEVIGVLENKEEDILKEEVVVNDNVYRPDTYESSHVVDTYDLPPLSDANDFSEDDDDDDQDEQVYTYDVKLAVSGNFFDGKYYRDLVIPLSIKYVSHTPVKSPAYSLLSQHVDELRTFISTLRYNGGKNRFVKATYDISDMYFTSILPSEYSGKGLSLVFSGTFGLLDYKANA
jgi:hypothetical protein